jgi:hypothetical protein
LALREYIEGRVEKRRILFEAIGAGTTVPVDAGIIGRTWRQARH